jgi:hypothetical protein
VVFSYTNQIKTIMLQSLKKALLVLLVLAIGFGCQKEEDTPTCTRKAFYRGTEICYSDDLAAAIEMEETGKYLIVKNFFDLIEPSDVSLGASILVNYEDTAEDGPNPELCGVLITAPIIEVTCAQVP